MATLLSLLINKHGQKGVRHHNKCRTYPCGSKRPSGQPIYRKNAGILVDILNRSFLTLSSTIQKRQKLSQKCTTSLIRRQNCNVSTLVLTSRWLSTRSQYN